MSDTSRTVFQIGAESLGKAIHPRKHTRTVDDKIETQGSFLATFNASLERSRILIGDKAETGFLSLCDEAKYSDPISSAGTKEIENRLLALISELEKAISEDSDTRDLISEIRKRLAIRNHACMSSK